MIENVLIHPFKVLHLVLDSGERLPCLVDSATWLPARVATRWAVRYRRYHLQSSTLADNLRVLCRMYTWARLVGRFDLDDYLTSGKLLRPGQIESLVSYLRTENKRHTPGKRADHTGSIVQVLKAETYDHHLAIIEDFLKWSLDPENRGGVSSLTLDQMYTERTRLELLFQTYYIGTSESERIEPLTDAELLAIRKAIEPIKDDSGQWTFPRSGFAEYTRFRNWLMFQTALELGLRRGELLKLRIDSLPRGQDDWIVVRRYPDDPLDSRPKEPAVKTSERIIRASDELRSALRAYYMTPPPLGRMRGNSIYLFVTRTGAPLSLDRADDIIQTIGKISGVQPLSWHRLRHTWAENTAKRLSNEPNWLDQLMYLGGWSHPASVSWYTKKFRQEQGNEALRKRQDGLYDRKEIQDEDNFG